MENIIARAVESIAFENKTPLEAANAIMDEIDWEAVASDANCSSAKYSRDEYRISGKTLGAGDANGAVSSPADGNKQARFERRKRRLYLNLEMVLRMNR